MQLDIKKAFLAPFSEEKWYLKLIFPAIVFAFSIISGILYKTHKIEAFLLSLLILVPYLVWIGLLSQFAHNEIKDELTLLPELKSKVKQYFIYGVNFLAAYLIYALVFCLIAVVFAIILAVLSFATGANKLTMAIIFTVLFVPVAIAVMAILVLIQGAFADNFSIKNTLNIKRIWALICKAKAEIAIYLLLSLVLAIALKMISIILAIPVITIVLIPFCITIEQLISVDLKAQVYKVAKSRLEQPQQITT